MMFEIRDGSVVLENGTEVSFENVSGKISAIRELIAGWTKDRDMYSKEGRKDVADAYDEKITHYEDIIETLKKALVQRKEDLQKTDFYKDVEKMAEVNGYKLEYCWFKDGSLRFGVTSKEDFVPTIYCNFELDDSFNFSMQTTSYGALKGEQLDNFFSGMSKGYDFVNYLNSLDWSECPVFEDD